jgi:CHRD domain-containing protein
MMSRTSTRIALGTTVLIVAACTPDRPAPTEVLRAPVFARQENAGLLSTRDVRHLDTDLEGSNEVPPHITPASGEARFRVRDDGTVSYQLLVEDIRNPFMAHIHIGSPGANGPIVVWLFPSTAPVPGPAGSGLRDGLLAEGTFTASDLVGPLKNHPLSNLLDAIRQRTAYVNVHTNDGSATPGPGNFPGGEIRGQLGLRNEQD